VSRNTERILKIDYVEQAFHVLQPGGVLIVWSDYETDQLFPGLLKKVFGKIHSPASDRGTLLWCQRKGERPRRRHEVTVQARVLDGPSLRFITRPGVFTYGRFDDGARALVESAWVQEGDRVLDVGCGCGTNGAFAWQRCGPTGHVTFMDSNLRATALAQLNAEANGVTSFDVVPTFRMDGVEPHSYDVVLANPPYFAGGSIAEMFVRRGAEVLKPEGRFYLVTRQPKAVEEVMDEVFDGVEMIMRRGYAVFGAWASAEAGGPLFTPNGSEGEDENDG
jgi:16S rRNA (guanine1207-N2)-methyltransferase